MKPMPITIKGYYHDRLLRNGNVILDRGWRSNRIMDSCGILLAALMKGENGLAGIMYLAVGEGRKGWDGALPLPDPSASGLAGEILRRPLSPGDTLFLDPEGRPTSTPTSCLQIELTFSRDDFAGAGVKSLREFGLFGGNASGATGSGFLINHVIHPRIDLTSSITLQRTLRLDFSPAFIPLTPVKNFGGHLPVRCIDGVGEVYGAALQAAGITTLAELTARPFHQLLDEVPQVKLMEFRAKAALVLAVETDLSLLAGLDDLSASDILKLDPFSSDARNMGIVAPEQFLRLQEELAVLQVALDEWELQQLSGRDLLNLAIH